MAITITATTPRSGWSAPRTAVVKKNRFWPNTASVRLVAPPVKLKQVQAIDVLGWDPDQGETDIPIGHSQSVNFAIVRSNPLEYEYDEATDFLDGQLDDVELAGAGLQLVKDRRTNDFDQYPVGGLPTSDFTQVSAAGAWAIQQDAGGNRRLRAWANSSQNRSMVTYDVESSSVNLVAQVKMKFHTADYSGGGILFRAIGSDGTFSAYSLECRNGFNRIWARRYATATFDYYLGEVTTGVTPVANDGYWYNLKGWMDGNNIYGKIWREDQAEPASWLLVASDTVLPGPGEVGLVNYGRHQNAGSCSFDDMAFEDVPTTYKAIGQWISQRHPLAAIDRYSQSIVTWDETLQPDTSIVVQCQRDVGAPWEVCENGEPLPGFEFDDGLQYDNLRFKVTLASTDDSVTPEFSDLRFEFIRLDWDLVEIVVNGYSSIDGVLGHWGQRQFTPVVGGWPHEMTYDDIWVQNFSQWWFNNVAGSVPVEFRYSGVFVDGISWSSEGDPFLTDYLLALSWTCLSDTGQRFPILEWSCIEDARKGIADIDWVVLDGAPITAAECEWALIDSTPGLQATGSYWVALQILNEFVSSQQNGVTELAEFVSSSIVNGIKIDEFNMSAVVQGAKLDEFVSSILPAIETLSEFPASQLNGVLDMSEFPTSHLVYGVTKDGAIFINLIDDETYQKLLDSGVVFS